MVVYGCTADDWKDVTVSEEFTPDFVSNVHFSGQVTLGVFERIYELPGGVKRHSGIND